MAKCSECGFLALRKTESRELVDAEQAFRKTGNLPTGFKSTDADVFGGGPGVETTDYYEGMPTCFVLAANLSEEIGTRVWDEKERLKVISKERECNQSTKWKQGFTPKEHAQMILSKELLNSEHKWRDDQAKQQHEWRQDDLKQSHEWRKEDVDLIKVGMKSSVWTQFAVAAISAAVAFAVAGFAYLLSIQGTAP